MKRTIVIIAALALLAIPRTADAQKHRSYVIGFYNLENLWADAVRKEYKYRKPRPAKTDKNAE